MKRVLVTGAEGFIGPAACARLDQAGVPVRRALRRQPDSDTKAGGLIVVGDVDGSTDWAAALDGVSHVLHLANRAHRLEEDASDPLAEYRRVNVDGTRAIALQAAAAGVRRFVFISSIKVNGEATTPGRPFRADDPPDPQDIYALSKREAEDALRDISMKSNMEMVIVRPPLVYGPGVKANFRRLLAAVDAGYPLPLAGVRNARSMVYLENLVDLLFTCMVHPAAPGRTFLVTDRPPLSTPELVRKIAAALGRQPRLLPAPSWLLRAGASATGRRTAVERLLSTLVVHDTATRRDLGWRPPYTTAEGLAATARWFVDLAGTGRTLAQ
jgi:nucleoside-diphosphate-sugar epimerase